jgi:DNA-binding IscR family transcriptional regulator
VYKINSKNEGCKVELIAQKTGFSPSYIKAQISALIQANKIEHRGSKKTGGYYIIENYNEKSNEDRA